MIGKTNVQSSVTEKTVNDWGFTKGNLTSVDIDEEVVESPEMEYATVGYVEQTIVRLSEDVGQVISELNGKQEELVSGTNIKTVNGESILGSGDITISGVTEDYVDNAIANAITTTLNTEV